MKLKSHTEIIPYKNNAKTHPDDQLLALAKIVNEVGWRVPCLINKNKIMIAGHGRLEMFIKYKDEYKIKPIWVMCDGITVYGNPDKREMTEEQEGVYRIADNKLAESDWDFPKLKDELQDLDTGKIDLELTGFNMSAIEDMMTKFGDEYEGNTDDDAIPEDVKPICKIGQLWKLGKHRLLCGDATKKEDVERLMDGDKADMIFTDPPYGVDYNGEGVDGATGAGKRGKIQGDGDNNVAVKSVEMHLNDNMTKIWWGASCYPQAFKSRCTCMVWDKEIIGDRYSPIDMALVENQKRVGFFRHQWHGMIKSSEQGVRRVHPTQKPIALAEWCFDYYGDPKSVLDLFGGSGSTLIACEKTNRKCYMMEIDEHYCDIIIKRWEDYTGNRAELINGNP